MPAAGPSAPSLLRPPARLILGPMDTMILDVEGFGPPMNVLAALELDGEASNEEAVFVVERIAASQLCFRAVLELPLPAFGRAAMREVPDFSPADRLTRVEVPVASPDAAAEAIHAYAAGLVARRLPRDRPLWEAHLVCFRAAAGAPAVAPPRSVLFIFWSHALLDGMGGFGILSAPMALVESGPVPPEPVDASTPAPSVVDGSPESLFFTLASAITFSVILLFLVPPRLVFFVVSRLLDRWPPRTPAPNDPGPDSAGRSHASVHPVPPPPNPASPPGGALRTLAYPFAWIAAHVSYAWQNAGLLVEPRSSPFFQGTPSDARSVHLSKPIPLHALKAAARDGRLGAGQSPPTVNEALLGLIAAALAAEAPATGSRAKRPLIQIPVDVRRFVNPPHGAGNAVGFVRIRLPAAVGELERAEKPGYDPHLAARVRRVVAQLRWAKRSLEPVVDWRIMATLGVLPQWVLRTLYGVFLSERSMFVTNCQGPQRPLYLSVPPGSAPLRITSLWACGPQPCIGGSSACIVGLDGQAGPP